jgi:hypothetical protein
MSQTTEEQQQMEAAARSIAAKLQAFHDRLTPDEQHVLDSALRSIAAGADETADDTTGYLTPASLPLISVKILELYTQSQQPPQTPQRQ